MPNSTSSISKKYIAHLKYLDYSRVKMENLYSSRTIAWRDIEQLYTGLYMEAITSLERSIEILFIGLLNGSIKPSSSAVVPKVIFKSAETARDIVYGGQDYVDWLPFYKTENRASAFFRKGRPFSTLQRKRTNKHQLSDIEKLGRIQYVRNAIAHKSRHAIKVFENNVIEGRHLKPHETKPAGFLRVVYRNNPQQTWYELLIKEMAEILRAITDFH